MITRALFKTVSVGAIGLSFLFVTGCGLEDEISPVTGDRVAPEPTSPQDKSAGRTSAHLPPPVVIEVAPAMGDDPSRAVLKRADHGIHGDGTGCEEPRLPHQPAPTKAGDTVSRSMLVPACRDDAQAVLPQGSNQAERLDPVVED